MALRTPLSVTPHLYMGDSTGRPLDKGVVYFGEQDKDPEFYPINLFSDDALTKPLAQPVHTKGGYLYDKGDMVEPHAKELIYSVKVLDSYGRKVFYKGAMMRNSWNDDVISQIGAAIIESQTAAVIAAEIAVQDAINNTAVEGGVLADTFVTATAKFGGVARTQADKNADVIYAADIGMVANDPTFDNAPLFSLLNGRTLHLESGATYYTGSTVIVSSKNVAIVSDGAPAKIHCLAVGKSCFETDNSEGYSTNIVESITIGHRYIKVADASTIKSGDILELVSSKLWHADHRDQTYKSQLCKVHSVIGNTLYLYDTLLESYDISVETVVVTSYTPSNVNIRNVTFQCTPIPNSDGNRPAAKALVIKRATDSYIDNVSTIDGQATGIFLYRCYNTTVSGGVSTGCNAYQTGYGVQTSGTSNCTVTGHTILGSRRGVDVSGIGVVSTNTRVTYNTVVGGGVNSWGETYGWKVDDTGKYVRGAYQGGVGSHGSANYTYTIGNILQNLHAAVQVRGIQEHVIGNYIYGMTRLGAIRVYNGGDVFIEGNFCISGHNDGVGRDLDIFDGGGNKFSRVADTFVLVGESFKGRLVIRNNTVDVQEVFVTISNSLSTKDQALIITDNIVKHTPMFSSTLCYLLNTEDGTPRDVSFSSPVIKGNQQSRYSGSGELYIIPPDWTGSNGLYVGADVPTDVISSVTTYTREENATTAYGGNLAAQRVGNVVSCNLLVVFAATTADTVTKILIDVPFLDSMDFESTNRATGLAVTESGDVGFIEARSGTKQVVFSITPSDVSQQRAHLSFSYFT